MRMARELTLIAAGYAVSVAGGVAAVVLNELRLSREDALASSGMAAFGDMVLFVLVVGLLGLVPSWFLLRMCAAKAPRAVLVVVLAIAALGPLSWYVITTMPAPRSGPGTLDSLSGAFTAFVAIPRVVFGPILLLIEAATFYFLRARHARVLLAVAMLMDLAPMALFGLHMASSIH